MYVCNTPITCTCILLEIYIFTFGRRDFHSSLSNYSCNFSYGRISSSAPRYQRVFSFYPQGGPEASPARDQNRGTPTCRLIKCITNANFLAKVVVFKALLLC